MNLEIIVDPWKKREYLFSTSNDIDWKGTIGVGDILFGLNTAYMATHIARKKRDIEYTTLNVYWEHAKDYLHHFEDPETIIERADYLQMFYHDKESVKMNHIFNSTDEEIKMLRYRGIQRYHNPSSVLDGIPSWIFRRDSWCDNPVENKVVFWRPLFNANIPRGWKRIFTNKHWEQIIGILERRGFSLVELSYRTPVHEAFYHINTSRFCIFYDGMWQYIARNICKPVISLGDSNILSVHSPQGVCFKTPEPDRGGGTVFSYLKNIEANLEHLDRRCSKYRNLILGELNVEDRPRGN